jgi:hypothetical protein
VSDKVPFRILEEKGYLYQLNDDAILKIEFHLEQLAKAPLGTFSSKGTKKSSVIAPGFNLSTFQPFEFQNPDMAQLGSNKYYLPEQHETLRIVPQLRVVERTVDSRGIPAYNPKELDWFPEIKKEKILKALERPGRTFLAISQADVVAAAIREKTVLEWLFPKGWFTQNQEEVDHPAWKEWKICHEIIQWNGFKPDAIRTDYMRTAAKVAIDALLLVRLSEGDLGTLIPGRWAAFGDQKVLVKIRSRIVDAEDFKRLLVELYTAGWHKREGRTVTLSETEGYSDVRVKFASLAFPIHIECKRVSTISENRIQYVIKKASTQIEVASQGADADGYGAVLLDFTGEDGARPQKDDSTPPDIVRAMELVRRALTGNKNTHVKSALVVWDGYHVTGNPPGLEIIQFKRSARIIHHSLNRNPLTIDRLFDGYFSGVVTESVPDEYRFFPDTRRIPPNLDALHSPYR